MCVFNIQIYFCGEEKSTYKTIKVTETYFREKRKQKKCTF